jgi:hypothetical protein
VPCVQVHNVENIQREADLLWGFRICLEVHRFTNFSINSVILSSLPDG